MVINISIEGKRATVQGAPVIVCGNSDYTIAFDFDDEWAAETAKTARFMYYKNGQALHQDKIFIGNTVEVPILSGVEFVYVGAFAGDLRTTTPAKVACSRSILCGDPVHEDPPQDVYDQIMALLNKNITDAVLLVTVTDGIASHTPADIEAHVLLGGTAMLHTGGAYIALSTASSSSAEFIAIDGEHNSYRTYYLYPNKEVEKYEHFLADYSDLEKKAINVSGAMVGQTIKITATDSNGKPTAWQPTDLPAHWVEVVDFHYYDTRPNQLTCSSYTAQELGNLAQQGHLIMARIYGDEAGSNPYMLQGIYLCDLAAGDRVQNLDPEIRIDPFNNNYIFMSHYHDPALGDIPGNQIFETV